MQKYFDYNLVDNINDINIADNRQHAYVVNCLNPHSFVTALDDNDFAQALRNSDYLLPDGEGICMTLRKWAGITIDKIAGDDIHRHLLSQVNAIGGKVYYMGSTETVLALIKARLSREYPHITTRSFSPSFGPEIGETESQTIVDDINTFNPDVLFVSMTAPKQEKWVEKHRHEIGSVKVIANIGAVFDFYAGTVKRAPKWVVDMKLEWLVRLIKEPRRMWRRNFVSTPRFLRWVRQHKNTII